MKNGKPGAADWNDLSQHEFTPESFEPFVTGNVIVHILRSCPGPEVDESSETLNEVAEVRGEERNVDDVTTKR